MDADVVDATGVTGGTADVTVADATSNDAQVGDAGALDGAPADAMVVHQMLGPSRPDAQVVPDAMKAATTATARPRAALTARLDGAVVVCGEIEDPEEGWRLKVHGLRRTVQSKR